MNTAELAAVVELPFRRPYDWPRVLRFFAGRAIPGVEAVADGAYCRAIEWNGAGGLLTVRAHARRACLVARIDGPASAGAAELAAPLARMFDVHANPADIAAALRADPWLAPLVDAAPGLRVPGAWSGFELIVRAIVGQQVSVKAATTIVGRLVARVGERIDEHVDSAPHAAAAWRFPTPAALAAADLAGIGMPGARVAALQGFARAVAAGDVAVEAPQPGGGDALSARRAQLLALPGIGPWTVEYVAMRAWRDADAWPATDLVLMQALAARDPALRTAARQRTRTATWQPWRAYAAMHLWNEIADRAGAARGG